MVWKISGLLQGIEVVRRGCFVVAALALFSAMLTGCSPTTHIPDEAPIPDYRTTSEGDDVAEGSATLTSEEDVPKVHAVGPVALVDGEPVSAEDFNANVEALRQKGTSEEQIRELKDALVRGLVNEFLIRKKMDTLSYPVSEATIKERLDELITLIKRERPMSDTSEQGVMKLIAKELGVDEDKVLTHIQQAVQLEMELQQKGFLKPITKEDAEAFYKENPTVSEKPELVTARHILLKVEEGASEQRWEERKKEALEILKLAKKVKSAEEFGKLAEEKSEGVTKQNQGSIGLVYPGMLTEEFDKELFALKEGEVSQPVRTKIGWHIIYVEKKEPARKVPFEELDSKIRAHIRRARLSEQLPNYLDVLRGGHEIVLKPENIK